MLAKRRFCICSKMTDWVSMCRPYTPVSVHSPHVSRELQCHRCVCKQCTVRLDTVCSLWRYADFTILFVNIIQRYFQVSHIHVIFYESLCLHLGIKRQCNSHSSDLIIHNSQVYISQFWVIAQLRVLFKKCFGKSLRFYINGITHVHKINISFTTLNIIIQTE